MEWNILFVRAGRLQAGGSFAPDADTGKAREDSGRQILTRHNVRGAPDLVGEVGSPRTRKRDETIKRRLYERFGVSEYWVIDPELDIVRLFRGRDGEFGRPVELS